MLKVDQIWGERSKEINLEHLELGGFMKYPVGDVRHPVVYQNLKFRIEYGLEILIRVQQHADI